MKIDSLKLLNFRSYSSIYFEFNPNINIIYGLNGHGKTNIVEAIYALSLTKSFRTNNDSLMNDNKSNENNNNSFSEEKGNNNINNKINSKIVNEK